MFAVTFETLTRLELIMCKFFFLIMFWLFELTRGFVILFRWPYSTAGVGSPTLYSTIDLYQFITLSGTDLSLPRGTTKGSCMTVCDPEICLVLTLGVCLSLVTAEI